MSDPRRVLCGTTYLVTRRCSERRFFLLPSALVNAVFLYCVAVAAYLTGMKVHALTVLSNHWHCVLTDHEGRLPEFCAWVHKHVAKCLNVSMGRWESFWAPGSYSAVRLDGAEDVLDKLVYTLANPVQDGLVKRAVQWGGLTSAGTSFGAELEGHRPQVYFDPRGALPTIKTVPVERPPQFSHLTDEEFTDLVDKRVRERERQTRRELRTSGRSSMGMKKVLRQSRYGCPRSHAPRRNLNPRVACRGKWDRIAALQRLRDWLASYRDALARFRDGVRDVVFPEGTYWMRLHAGVVCGPGA